MSREAISSQSWFALKKDEFYVILDSVLKEMTQREEQHGVSGCIELIKLLSDNENTILANKDGDRINPTKTENDAPDSKNGFDDRRCDYRGHRKSNDCDTVKPIVCRIATPAGSNDLKSNSTEGNSDRYDYTRSFDTRHFTGFKSVQSQAFWPHESCAGKQTTVDFGKFRHETKQRLISDKIKELKSNKFCRNRGEQRRKPNCVRGLLNNFANAQYPSSAPDSNRCSKSPSLSALRSKLPRIKITDRYYATNKFKRARPNLDRHQRPETSPRRPIDPNDIYQTGILKSHTLNDTLIEELSFSDMVKRQGTTSPINCCCEKQITKNQAPEVSLGSGNIVKHDTERPSTAHAPDYAWTPVDKSVINDILDAILNSEDYRSTVTTRKTECHDELEVRSSNQSVNTCKQANVTPENALSVLKTSTEDLTSSDSGVNTHDADVDDVIAKVKLVDVRRLDVSEMSFKWKSKLLWRLRHDKVSQTCLPKMCLT